MCGSVSVKGDKFISLSVGFTAQNNNRSTDNVRSRLPLVRTKFWFARHFHYPGYQRFFLACDGELRFVGRRPTRVRPKAEDRSGEATHFSRLDRKRKPRLKSPWHPGYILTGYVNNRPEKKITLLRFERTSMFFSHQVFACLLEHSSDRDTIFLAGHHVRQRSQIYFELWVYIILKWNVQR